MLSQLQHQYRLMQQHQQQLRNQQQTPSPLSTTSEAVTQSFNSQQYSQGNGTPTVITPKLVQPSIPPPVSNCLATPSSNFTDLDVSDEDLKDLLSQKGLATTLAENLLKHFGSDDINIKEEPGESVISISFCVVDKNKISKYITISVIVETGGSC